MKLTEQKQALADIFVSAAGPQTKLASRELRYYLGLMTGIAFEIVEECDPARKIIALEQINADPELGDEGFRFTSSERGLTISGGKRGLLYGVYEMLERLGCRFFTSKDEFIPFTPEVDLPEWNETVKPVFEYRHHNTREIEAHQRFALKLRINGSNISEQFGGNMKYALFVHSLNRILPLEKYGKEHPEYYSMRDGVRYIPENPALMQVCLTNPEVLQIAIENVRRILQENPDCRIISISQMDNQSFCTCPECAAVDQAEGSSSGTMLRFVNAIADALKEEFPQVIFDTLAYQYTRPVSGLTRPRENVCVRLCSIECCFSHAMEKCDDTTRGVQHPDGTHSDFVTDLRNWSKVCNRMYIWDYLTCFSHYAAPHPNWRTLQPNMQFFAKNNVKGVFEQANSKYGGGPDLIELRQYVVAKLLWDPDCDVEKHITEFLNYFYGDAADAVREYMNAVCDKCEQDNIHVGFNDLPTADFMTEDMLDIYDEILDRAAKAVAADPLRAFRVARIRFCTEYLRLKRKAMLQNEVDGKELNDFFNRWRAYGFTRMHEWVDLDLAHYAFLKGKWRGEELLKHWAEEAAEIV